MPGEGGDGGGPVEVACLEPDCPEPTGELAEALGAGSALEATLAALIGEAEGPLEVIDPQQWLTELVETAMAQLPPDCGAEWVIGYMLAATNIPADRVGAIIARLTKQAKL